MRALACLAVCVVLACGAPAQDDREEEMTAAAGTTTVAPTPANAMAVRQAAEALLAGISNSDTTALRRIMLPEARLIAVADDPEAPVRISDLGSFLAAVADPDQPLLERMWDSEVRIDGNIATVWTPYDFYRGGAFSHCGIDAFQFARRPDGWKAISVIYTVHRDETTCPPSPLGPP